MNASDGTNFNIDCQAGEWTKVAIGMKDGEDLPWQLVLGIATKIGRKNAQKIQLWIFRRHLYGN